MYLEENQRIQLLEIQGTLFETTANEHLKTAITRQI